MITTDSSPCPFAQDELVAILDIVNSLKGASCIVPSLILLNFSEDDEKIDDPYSIWVIGMIVSCCTVE